MKQALPQMDALATWAAAEPEAAQRMLRLTANWHVDPHGIVHGKPHIDGSTDHTGTLGQILGMPRCPDKGCATATRIAGLDGNVWATRAQRLAAVDAELAALEEAHTTEPWTVVAKTAELLEMLTTVTPASQATIDAVRDVHDRALAIWHDPHHVAERIRAAAIDATRHSDGPLDKLRDRVGWSTILSSPLHDLVADCDGTPAWVDTFLAEHAKHVESHPHAAVNVPRIRELDTPELRATLNAGVPLLDALVNAHLADIETLARSIPAWWQHRVTELLADERVALVATSAHLTGTLGAYEMYREHPNSPLLLTPVAVAEHILSQLSGTMLVLDETPPESCLDIARTLTRDALATTLDVNLEDILAASRVLAQ